jgi:hypothetical protein
MPFSYVIPPPLLGEMKGDRMKKQFSALLLALTLIAGISAPKKAEAGLIVTGAGIMSSGDRALGITFVGLGIAVMGVLVGNGALLVLDQDTAVSPLYPIVANKFEYLQDQPAVIQSIASKLETQVLAIDAVALGAESVEVKLSNEEIEAILAAAVVTEDQALEIAQFLK